MACTDMKYLNNFEQLQWSFALRDELLKALSLLYPMQYTKQRLNLSKITPKSQYFPRRSI